MRLSTRTRYGFRAIIDLAVHRAGGPVRMKDICGRQRLSKKYLEQIFRLLQGAGLIQAVRGNRGGYILTREPRDLLMNEVFRALEGNVEFVECISDPNVCGMAAECAAQSIWRRVWSAVDKALASFSLQDAADLAKKKSKPIAYQI